VKKNNGTDTFFAYDEAGHLIGEYDATGATIQETIWLGDIPVAVLKPSGGGGVTTYYIWSDQLNTPRLITDVANNARWEWANNDPFGNNAANENPAGLGAFTYNLRFPGQYYDAETGNHYNYFRDYDPRIGRYTQSDPIGLFGGSNSFAYVSAAPLTFEDTFGLQQRSVNPRSLAEFIRPGGHTQPLVNAEVRELTESIRTFDPTFRYATLAGPGYQYSRQDVGYLRDLLTQYRDAGACMANGLPARRINYGQLPNGIPFSRHYGAETGPVRNIPPSVVEQAISRGTERLESDGRQIYYDAINDISVVMGRNGIMSVHRGP
jgi:RHS repeat-associated protein